METWNPDVHKSAPAFVRIRSQRIQKFLAGVQGAPTGAKMGVIRRGVMKSGALVHCNLHQKSSKFKPWLRSEINYFISHVTTLALNSMRQSARMSEIKKNVG